MTAAKKVVPKKKVAAVPEEELLSFVERSMKTYGQEVNLERAVPDFRDGLKPVQRRIAWSMHQLHLKKAKAARIVGDTMGKFHPHGDLSIMGALANMVTSQTNIMKGTGNWGTLVDPPAAMRYPEAGLSNFGRTFFGKDFTSIIDYVPNFDRSNKEPMVLPSLLPNLLFNGTSGIGVGMATDIPAFTPPSVLKMMVRMLDKEELTSTDFAKGLEFFFQYGGTVVKNPVNRKAIVNLFENTKGTVQWESPLEVDTAKKQIVLWKFAPTVNPVPLVEGTKDKMGRIKRPGIRDWDSVARAIGSKGVSYTITARKDLNMNEFHALVDRVKKETTVKVSYEVYVTERILAPELGEGKYKVNFFTCSIPDLFVRWLKWRVKLEARSLDWRIGKVEENVAYIKLLMLAADNLEVVFKALRSPDSAAYLSKGLKITLAQANQILDLQVRRLSKLDRAKLDDTLAAVLKDLAELKKKRKDPAGQVRNFLAAASEAFELETQFAGTHQWTMKPLKLALDEEVEVVNGTD